MHFFTKSKKDKKLGCGLETKNWDCELKFKKEYDEVRNVLKKRFFYFGYNGIVIQDYFHSQNGWVKPYLLEEQLGIAILQRSQRLINMKPSEQEENSGPESKPPEYNSVVPSILTEEIQKLRGEYWKNQCNMRLLDAIKPINSAPVQEQMVLRNHKDRHGRPYSWVMAQEGCASWGGCCGRGCGCCGKTLDQFLAPGMGQRQETKEAKVLGHCTVECRCCIEYRGCYVPDSRLPPPAL